MNGPPVHSTQWLEVIDAFIAGELSSAEIHEFRERLRDDEEARLVYVEYLDLHFELLHSAGRIASPVSPELEKPSAPLWLWGTMTAAAAVCLVALNWMLWTRKEPELAQNVQPAITPADRPIADEKPAPPAPPAVVARLGKACRPQWTDSGFLPVANGPVREGDVLDLHGGSVEVQFASGAQAFIAADPGGAARVRVISALECFVEAGQTTFHVPPEARGFAVRTSSGRFVDLGTDFGVAADPRGLSEVHVLDGVVEASSNGSESAPLTLTRGLAVRVQPGQAIPRPIAFRPESFVQPAMLSWGVRSFDGSVKPHVVAPQNLTSDESLTLEDTHLILECQGAVVENGFQNHTAVTFEDSNSERIPLSGFSVPQGDRVDSYLFHGMPTPGGAPRSLVGSVQFERPVLAVIETGPELTETARQFGIEGLEYPTANGFGLEVPAGPGPASTVDRIVLSADRRSLSFVLNAGGSFDQFRILVAAEPDRGPPMSAPVQPGDH